MDPGHDRPRVEVDEVTEGSGNFLKDYGLDLVAVVIFLALLIAALVRGFGSHSWQHALIAGVGMVLFAGADRFKGWKRRTIRGRFTSHTEDVYRGAGHYRLLGAALLLLAILGAFNSWDILGGLFSGRRGRRRW